MGTQWYGRALSSSAVDRRSFLRIAGGIGMGAALGSGLAACSNESGTGDGGTGPLQFMAWDFQPNTIKRLVKDWAKQNETPTRVQITPNVGYSAAIQTRLRGGAELDLYYNFAYNSQKFVDQDWAATLNDLPNVDEMVSEMFPSARERHVNSSGDIISVPYFSAVYMNQFNRKFVTEAGFSGPPTSLEETYQQSKKMKDDGICETPYLAYWVKVFCEEYFNVYLLANGVTPFDDKGEPVFADDSKAEDVFAWWQSMFMEGLAPKSLLSDDPGKLSGELAQGRGAFFVLHHYFLSSVRGLEGPHAANVDQAPVVDGQTLQIGEVLQMGSGPEGKRRDDVWALMQYYGWKDDQGRFSVFEEWAKAAGLAAPYPGFFTDKAVTAAFPDYYDLNQISQTFESGSSVVPARILPWYPDFQAKVGDVIHALLLGQSDPKGTVSALVDAARKAKSGGGL